MDKENLGLLSIEVVGPEPKAEPEPEVIPAFLPTPAEKQLPRDWTLTRAAGLIRDIAQELYETKVILEKHGLSQEQYDVLSATKFFQDAVAEFRSEWHSAINTNKRLALEAAIALEDAMPVVVARAHNKHEPLNEVVSLVKLLAEISGSIGAKAAAGGVSTNTERFKIVFNIGTAGKQTHDVQIEVPATPLVTDTNV